MARRGRLSRVGTGLLLLGVAVGGVIYFNRNAAPETSPGSTGIRLPTQEGPKPEPATQPKGETDLVILDDARTARSTQPGDIEAMLKQADAAHVAGDSVKARNDLNAALLGLELFSADAKKLKSKIAELNQAVIFAPDRFGSDSYNGTYKVAAGDNMQSIAKRNAITWELLCKINNISDPKRLRANQTLKTITGPFHAVVSKSAFELDIFLGSPGESGATYVRSFNVGLGTDDSTPLGEWKCSDKLKNPTYYSPRGEGVIAGDDPKNPLGERWIALEGVAGEAVGKTSYGIHGTIDPTSIGKRMSMGCIRLRNEDIEQVYDLLIVEKSRVKIVP